jgi:hypothetical protein
VSWVNIWCIKKCGRFVLFGSTAAPLIVYNRLYMYVQAVKVTRPGARKKDTAAPKYSWCRIIVCVLGQYVVHKKVLSLCTFRLHGCSPYRIKFPVLNTQKLFAAGWGHLILT